MLENFFELNSPFDEVDLQEVLESRLRESPCLTGVLFRPDTLTPPITPGENPYTGKTFTNVSFSKTEITGVVFRECRFVDCLFIGTTFVGCEFHNCSFEGCNPYRATFRNTYIDPSVFVGMLHPVKHWNIGIYLFQKLYENSMESHQHEFANSAEFNRYKWRRYVLNHRYPGWGKTSPRYLLGWLTNWLFYIGAGYGIRSKFLAAWAMIVVVGSVSINFYLWDCFNIVGKNGSVTGRHPMDVVYYTLTIPGGVGDLTPTSDLGRVTFLVEAFFGLLIVSFLVTWLVKRALR